MQAIYLDNNATTKPAAQVLDCMEKAYKNLWANPSSMHRFGQKTRQQIELARNKIALLIGAKPAQIIFTSGATESNNLAIKGLLEPTLYKGATQKGALITTAIEHAAVREPAQSFARNGGEVKNIAIDKQGAVNAEDVKTALIETCSNNNNSIVLVSIQWANNETGVLQPIKKIGEAISLAKKQINELKKENAPQIYFHVDATQAVGKLPVDISQMPIDLLSFSGHKFHGPKATGVLYVRRGVRLQSLNTGGPQEREKRGGTENSIAIIGLGEAAELANNFVQDKQRIKELENLRGLFEKQITGHLNFAKVNCANAKRLWNTSNIAFIGMDAEAVLLNLSERGIFASAGAACSSGSLEPSPVLLAMGLEEEQAHGSVRFSLSRYTTKQEIDIATKQIIQSVQKLKHIMNI